MHLSSYVLTCVQASLTHCVSHIAEFGKVNFVCLFCFYLYSFLYLLVAIRLCIKKEPCSRTGEK